jgi:hypothetical protein
LRVYTNPVAQAKLHCIQTIVPGPPNVEAWGNLVSKPPDFEQYGPLFGCGDVTWQNAAELGLWRPRTSDTIGESLATLTVKAAIGSEVEVLFEDGKWYPGQIKSRDNDGRYKVEFDDGDKCDFAEGDPDVRLVSGSPQAQCLESLKPQRARVGKRHRQERIATPSVDVSTPSVEIPDPGPWEKWLDLHLPDLMHSSFRSARLGKVDKQILKRLSNADLYCDSSKRVRGTGENSAK